MKSERKIIGFIPARAGSQRVRNKNMRPLGGHPLLAYSIASALESGVFSRVIVSTESPEIQSAALHYGAEAPFLRPAEFAGTTSPDIDWLLHAFSQIPGDFDAYAILRPTSPFRKAETLRRAADELFARPEVESIRAVELCRQHPGKMWRIENDLLVPFLSQDGLEVPMHSSPYQKLPKVYVQTSSLEMARAHVPRKYRSIAGNVIAPFLCEGWEGFSIDYETDWILSEAALEKGLCELPRVARPPYP